jgi:hypothetical protein
VTNSENPRPDRAGRLMLIWAAIVPCVAFLGLVAAWWVKNGVPDHGRGLPAGVWLLAGLAVIGGAYWLAERYWIRKR